MTDYRVTITIRNGRLWRAIRAAGFDSLAAFARAYGLPYHMIVAYATLKLAPLGTRGMIRRSAQLMADALSCNVEDLFPPAVFHEALTRNSVELEMSEPQVAALMSKSPERLMLEHEASDALRAGIQTLPPRARDILVAYYGLNGEEPGTFRGVGNQFGITPERVRQIVLRGEKLLSVKSLGLREKAGALLEAETQ